MMKLALPAVLLLVLPALLLAQSTVHDYKVYAQGHEVGTATVTETVKDNRTIYRSQMDITVHIVFTDQHLEQDLTTVYEDGKLVEATINVDLNGKPHDRDHLTWNGDHYLRNIDGRETRLDIPPITFSNTRLFFVEPKGVGTSYSEKMGDPHAVEPMGGGVYKLHKTSHLENIYHFHNGKMHSAEFETKFLTTKLELVR